MRAWTRPPLPGRPRCWSASTSSSAFAPRCAPRGNGRGEPWSSKVPRGWGSHGCSRRHARGRHSSASASLRRGRRSSSRGFRSGSFASSSSARCWRPRATSMTAGWREPRRWRRTCSPERRRRPGAPSPGPAARDPGYAWQHGLYWLASNLAADSPLALVVDDLQWCDGPSARALAFIARRLEEQPLALILATRPLDPALTPERRRWSANLPRSCCACRP